MRSRLMLWFIVAWTCAAQQATTVSGVVIDASTRLPILGALVSATGGRSIRTDGEGRYSLQIKPASGVKIYASRIGYVRSVANLAPESLSLDFELKPLLKISGTLEDYDMGQPITGAHVFAFRAVFALGRVWPVPAGLITADTRNGRFEIRDLWPGSYILQIVPEEVQAVVPGTEKPVPSKKFHGWSFYPDVSRLDMASPVALTGNLDTPVRIRLRARDSRSITGVLHAPARVELVREVGNDSFIVASGTLSAPGPFRIDRLTEGDYRLTGRGFDGSYAELNVPVTDHDVTGVDLKPQPNPPVAGVVRMLEPDAALPNGLRVVSGDKQVRVNDGKFQIVRSPGVSGLRLAGLPEGYALASVQEFPQLTYTITSRTGMLRGNMGERIAVLLPSMKVLRGDFLITLAPGSYDVVVLDGEEQLLASVPAFIEAKTAIDGRQVEIRSGETTVLPIP